VRDDEKEDTPLLEKTTGIRGLQIDSQVKGISGVGVAWIERFLVWAWLEIRYNI
jgi:hypothetical protein